MLGSTSTSLQIHGGENPISEPSTSYISMEQDNRSDIEFKSVSSFISSTSNRSGHNMHIVQALKHSEGFVISSTSRLPSTLHPKYAHFSQWYPSLLPSKPDDESSILYSIDDILWNEFFRDLQRAYKESMIASVILFSLLLLWFVFIFYIPWLAIEEELIISYIPFDGWIILTSILVIFFIYWEFLYHKMVSNDDVVNRFQGRFREKGVNVAYEEYTISKGKTSFNSSYIIFTPLANPSMFLNLV